MANQVPEISLVSHSNLVFWWPAWAIGYLLALVTYLQGQPVLIEPGVTTLIHPSNNPGLVFIATLLFLIVFTNAKLRGIYSVVTIVTIAFFVVLFAWLGWWDDIIDLIPHLSARLNLGFYLLFSTALLIAWLLGFFVFDRLTYWVVRPGQIVQERLVGGGAHSYDTDGLVFERRDQDLFRHVILGLGAGDIHLITGGVRKETIQIPNVLFVDSKLRAVQELIAIQPDQMSAQAQATAATT